MLSVHVLWFKNRLEIVTKKLADAENEIVVYQEDNAQISSPSQSMKIKKKINKMELIRSVVVLLEKQFELLKIEEVRQRPIINVLDTPQITDKPVKPRKREIVMINTILGFFMMYISVILHGKAIKYGIYVKISKEIFRK